MLDHRILDSLSDKLPPADLAYLFDLLIGVGQFLVRFLRNDPLLGIDADFRIHDIRIDPEVRNTEYGFRAERCARENPSVRCI